MHAGSVTARPARKAGTLRGGFAHSLQLEKNVSRRASSASGPVRARFGFCSSCFDRLCLLRYFCSRFASRCLRLIHFTSPRSLPMEPYEHADGCHAWPYRCQRHLSPELFRGLPVSSARCKRAPYSLPALQAIHPRPFRKRKARREFGLQRENPSQSLLLAVGPELGGMR